MTIQKTLQKDSVLIGQLELYNRLWKEQDDIWQKAARKSGLPRTSYWILYTIVVTAPTTLSQADLCENWYFPRQTVNSAVKNWFPMDWSHFSRKKDLEISNTSGSHQREKNLPQLMLPHWYRQTSTLFLLFQRRNAAFS